MRRARWHYLFGLIWTERPHRRLAQPPMLLRSNRKNTFGRYVVKRRSSHLRNFSRVVTRCDKLA
jgi:hypothetical protein